MKITALTGGRDTGSARFRVRQYVPSLSSRGIGVREHWPVVPSSAGPASGPAAPLIRPLLAPAKLLARLPGVAASWNADATWLLKGLLSSWYGLEKLVRRPLIYDIDDAVWLNRPFAHRIARRATLVVAGNHYLAAWASTYCDRVRVIPTAVNLERYQPAEQGDADRDSFRIGWLGSRGNLHYLEALEPALTRVLKDVPSAQVHVMCDAPPRWRDLPAQRCHFHRWSSDAELGFLQQLDVGLMPLTDGPWERGKCSFKMLQYMACGIPVCISPVGMNAQVASLGNVGHQCTTHDQWIEAIRQLHDDPTRAATLGRNGRRVAEQHFSIEVVCDQLAGALREAVSG